MSIDDDYFDVAAFVEGTEYEQAFSNFAEHTKNVELENERLLNLAKELTITVRNVLRIKTEVERPTISTESKPVKCRVQRYDPTITEPPFEFITLGEVIVDRPDDDYLGEKFANSLSKVCYENGYIFRFYSMSREKGYEYDITVR